MARRYIGDIVFAKVYPLLVAKAEKKGRTRAEVDEVTRWLTEYDDAGIADHIARGSNYTTFLAEAPAYNPDAAKITGTICGYRVEDIEDPVEQKVRHLDKLVDELARGKAMEKIKRT